MMDTLHIVNFLLILIGAIIMLVGIIKAKDIMEYVRFVPENHRPHIKWNLTLHHGLRVFFFCGYLLVLDLLCLTSPYIQ